MKLTEMNLWDLHDDPTQVDGHEERLKIPKIAFPLLKQGKLKDKEIKIAEKTISNDANIAFEYAKNFKHGRFPAGEKAISKDLKLSFSYAFKVLKKKRFPLGEKILASNAEYSYLYAKLVLEDRFPEGERIISFDVYHAFLYARDVIHGRFPAAEEMMLKSSKKQAYLMMLDMYKERKKIFN